ncbi:MAG TPA: ubiquitin-like protein Pup [Actinobacteria bacterium]|nr:ubiquitin-like protein Pup [Actinomycetota bacterium]
MAEQERRQTRRSDAPQEQEGAATQGTHHAEELTEKIDDLLDEIDSVLEENAEEFVKNYVQKGGQ